MSLISLQSGIRGGNSPSPCLRTPPSAETCGVPQLPRHGRQRRAHHTLPLTQPSLLAVVSFYFQIVCLCVTLSCVAVSKAIVRLVVSVRSVLCVCGSSE
eukprot:scaffold96934_cov63-Phaeocystis_antarctica.AAC.1